MHPALIDGISLVIDENNDDIQLFLDHGANGLSSELEATITFKQDDSSVSNKFTICKCNVLGCW